MMNHQTTRIMSTKNTKNVKAPKAPKAVKKSRPEPLTDAEYCELSRLLEVANESNCVLAERSQAVTRLREKLTEAEDELRSARNENLAVHREIAPLFHRLPVV